MLGKCGFIDLNLYKYLFETFSLFFSTMWKTLYSDPHSSHSVWPNSVHDLENRYFLYPLNIIIFLLMFYVSRSDPLATNIRIRKNTYENGPDIQLSLLIHICRALIHFQGASVEVRGGLAYPGGCLWTQSG